MNKESVLHDFLNSFEIPAFEENSVNTVEADGSVVMPDYPYITYQVVTDSIGRDVAMTASIWYRSTNWAEINEKAHEISKAIGMGGRFLPCDGGKIWIRRGTPFAQSMTDESDDAVKRKYLNITAEYLTAD